MYKSVRQIPKELLVELYVHRRWSLREVAQYIGCSVDTVVRRMKAFEVPRRPVKKDIHRQTLLDVHNQQGETLATISQRFGVSPSTISNRLREYGTLSPALDRSADKLRKNPDDIEPERIKKAYESGNTTTAIAEMMGITRWKVLHILRRMGVSIRGRRGRAQPVQAMTYLYNHHSLSTADIGLAYGLQSNTIALYLRESGVTLRGKERNLDVHEIQRLRGEGASIREIAHMMNCSTSAVRSRLKS